MIDKEEIMEEKKVSGAPHSVNMVSGDKTTITAVKNVPSFDNSEVVVTLEDNKLKVMGSGLEIDKLDLEEGVLVLTGEVKSIVYSKAGFDKSLIKRIFK